MNIFNLLGDNLMWLGSEPSMRALALSLMPEAYEAAMRDAQMHRTEFTALRDKRAASRVENRAMVATALSGTKLNFKIDSDGDDDDDCDDDEDDYFNSCGYTVINGVAVLNICGALVNSDAWYLKYMGKCGYPHIQDRLTKAYNDGSVSSVLLSIESPGGGVPGVSETVDMIRAVNTFKPVSSFSANGMMSGGYWLGSAAGEIMGGSLAQFGSIGVIVTIMDLSKMYEMAGVNPQILREGKYKALASNLEPLSDAARAQIQADMKVINNAFEQSVATGRGVTQEVVHDQMGQGRTFWSQDAKSVGLIDSVGTLGQAVANSVQLAEKRAQQMNSRPVLTF
jgi:signal peptide peptidase SppA